MPSISHANPLYEWFVATLALAFQTNSVDIECDRHLQILRENVFGDRNGYGERGDIYIRYDAEQKFIRFTCQTPDQTRTLHGLTRKKGAVNAQRRLLVIYAPRALFHPDEKGKPDITRPKV